MLLVTLGTISYPFQRPLQWMEQLLENRVIEEPIFIQHGHTDLGSLAQHALVTAMPLVDQPQLCDLAQQARLVISHAGDGSTRLLVKLGVSFILVPRLARFGEHVDDHQIQLATSFQQYGIHSCSSRADLERFLTSPPPPCQLHHLFEGPKLAHYLAQLYPKSYIPTDPAPATQPIVRPLTDPPPILSAGHRFRTVKRLLNSGTVD